MTAPRLQRLLLLGLLVLPCGCRATPEKTTSASAPAETTGEKDPTLSGIKTSTDGKARAIVTHYDLLRARYKVPPSYDKAAMLSPFGETPRGTCHLVQVMGIVPPHRHVEHDEFFMITDGEGILYLQSPDGGIQSHEVEAGSIFFIPRGVAHAYKNLGGRTYPTRGVNMFLPAYTKPDRVPVSWPKGSGPSLETTIENAGGRRPDRR